MADARDLKTKRDFTRFAENPVFCSVKRESADSVKTPENAQKCRPRLSMTTAQPPISIVGLFRFRRTAEAPVAAAVPSVSPTRRISSRPRQRLHGPTRASHRQRRTCWRIAVAVNATTPATDRTRSQITPCRPLRLTAWLSGISQLRFRSILIGKFTNLLHPANFIEAGIGTAVPFLTYIKR